MKPTIFFLALLLSSLTFSAFAQKTSQNETKLIQLKEVFTSMSVDNDIDVVLTESKTGEMVVEGNAKLLDMRLSDGHLSLSKKQLGVSAPIKVHVPASYLSKIFMNGNGTLSSSAVLSNQKMKILLAGEAKIAVKSTGSVTVETAEEIQFVKGE
ncbi:MAG TPA: DUF2807 domain-containing protein [Flavisolibacter sp.]|nr:DUF2807 domain-containing protein [Flavisolibacter sp.]